MAYAQHVGFLTPFVEQLANCTISEALSPIPLSPLQVGFTTSVIWLSPGLDYESALIKHTTIYCCIVFRLYMCANFDLLATAFSMCLQGESLAVGSKDYNWVTTKSQLECGDVY